MSSNRKFSRRQFVAYIGAGAAGVGGVGTAVATADSSAGDRRIVWTRDEKGDPDTVRYISEERYRRLMVYTQLDIDRFLSAYPSVSFVSMSSSADDGGLALELYVDELADSSVLPDFVETVPTVVKRVSDTRYDPDGCRDRQEFSPLQSDIEIGVDVSSNQQATGTIGVIGYNADPDDAYESIVTAHHVVEDRINDKMYHPAFGDVDGRQVLDDPAMDATKYSAEVSAEVGATVESQQPDISGTWDFAGLTDATDGTGGVFATLAGKETCSESAEAISTTRDSIVKYQANYKDEHGVGGDSGGPYVDGDGKLVSLHFGDVTVDTPEGQKTYSIGPVGTETLNRLNVTLTDPSNIQ